MMSRSEFLHPPGASRLAGMTPALRDTLEAAEQALERVRARDWTPEQRWDLIRREARASAHIEDEYDEGRIEAHARALWEYLDVPLGEEQPLLDLHRRMMRGQPHAEPGRHRTVGVTVGGYRPPAPALVPSLMEELLRHVRRAGHGLETAVWSHVSFETIHPFADGNGRTGRALLQAVLECPIPLSPFILRERQTYYELFRRSEWEAWLEWFCRGALEEYDRLEKP